MGSNIAYLRKSSGGGGQQGLDEYPYLKHLMKLWPGDWIRQIEKMNEAVCMNNCVS